MNIVFLAPEFLPNWGGAGTYAIELVKFLSKKHEVHVVTLERKISGSDITYDDDKISDFFDNRIYIHNISHANDTFLYNLKFQFAVFKNLPKICKAEGIDLIHSDVPHMSDILLKISNFQTPNVTTIHTLIDGHKEGILASEQNFSEMDRSEKFTLGLYPVLKLSQDFYLKKSKNIITVSNWMKNILENEYPSIKNIFVTYNGVDHQRFNPNNDNNSYHNFGIDNKQIILFSSRLTVTKGLNYLIKAIPAIIQDNKDVHFIFCGAGSQEPWIHLLDKLCVNRSTYSFLGYLDYEKLPFLYAKSDVYVAPTLHENFPIRILEMMSSEKPVIASNICGIPEMIEDGKSGLLIPPNNVNEIIKSVLLLLEDNQKSKEISRNARNVILDRFTWDKIGEMTMLSYKNILES